MLTHRITRRIDLPAEPGQWVEARMPSLAILDRAREARSRKAFALMEGVDLAQLRNIRSEPTSREPEDDYDWQTMLGACLTGWSYSEPLTPENIAELDQATVALLLSALLPATEEEDARKKGSDGSTTLSLVPPRHPRVG
mgnify:CR=1 FL=1